MRLLRSHGMTTLTWDRHRGHASSYDVVTAGLNYRLDELRAAIGLVQLRRLPDENGARGRVSARYRESLDGTHGLSMPFRRDDERRDPSHHLAVVLLPEDADRDAVRSSLRDRGIQTSVHYPPIHLFTYYRERFAARPLPQTEAVARRLLTLPLFGRMTDDQVDAVVEGLLDAV
jgi:dTDP-4-amino-4,6-dideoxygalactose transaminase